VKTFRLIRQALLLPLAVLMASCGSLPVIKPLDEAGTQQVIGQCARPFLNVPYRLVHAIEAGRPGGASATVLGVSLFDPQAGTLHSAILTLEGFVLFDARYEKEIKVNRALPPFDAPHFGANMMADVRLMLLAPEGRLLQAGRLAEGSAVCRYDGQQGRTLDVTVHPDETWEIVQYGEHHELLRQVKAFFVRNGIPERMALTGFMTVNYELRLKLISAEAVSPEALRLQQGQESDDD